MPVKIVTEYCSSIPVTYRLSQVCENSEKLKTENHTSEQRRCNKNHFQ